MLCNHRALDDIRASIEELKIYRQSVFVTREEFVAKQESTPKPQSALADTAAVPDVSPL